MLRSLRIHNYAIIESVDVEFGPGMTVLTGETGAGKSILIGALSLALGERAEPEAIRSGESTAWVEGVFRLPPGHPLQDILRRQEILLPGGEALVRREIAASGRSRAFLNDVGVTLATLKRFGDACVDLHGQHEHQSLLQEEKHLDYLDGFGGLFSLRQEFAERFQDYHRIEQSLRALKAREALSVEHRELYTFQIEELEAARLIPGEEEALLAEGRVLENAERLVLAASQVIEELAEGENAICSRVEGTRKALEEPADLDVRLKEAVDGLAAVCYQAEDIASSLRQYRDKLEFDPDRLEEIRERLDEIWRMKKKYGGSVESALEQLERLRQEIGSQESRAGEIKSLEDEVTQSLRDLEVRVRNLSQKRQKAARELASKVKQELASLGLGKSQFEVRLTQEPSPDGLLFWKEERVQVAETGWDRVRFFFNANPGEDLRPLDRVASGGEISRVMLALKTVLADVDEVPTLIFDEIDAGIGGKVAEAVGKKLSTIARQRQVFCITHLPQIASQGDEHLLVEKREAKGRATVSVRKLSEGERIGELARMMAGKEITDLARAHAREMLKR